METPSVATRSGFLLLVDEAERSHRVREAIETRRRYTDTVSVPDWHPRQAELALISVDGVHLHWAALARRGRKIATAKAQLTVTDFVDLDALALEEITRQIGSRYKSHFIRSSTGDGSRVPPKTWQQVWALIRQLRPRLATELDRLETLCSARTPARSPAFEIMAQEKDSVGLALDFVGLGRSYERLAWSSGEAVVPAPFLQGLQGGPGVRLREDAMLGHDAFVFSDWDVVRRYQVGAVQFVDEATRQQLTVMNVNRTRIETVLGVDLLYYHHEYESFVLVQYKRMAQSKDGTWIYRPNSDDSYEKEVARMLQNEALVHDSASVDPRHYRLHAGAFYFKLCPSVVFEALTADLIRGMYLPLDYWNILTQSLTKAGRFPGMTFKNAQRHLDNTSFVTLVQRGWVGSRLQHTEKLGQLIEELIKDGHSVILADGRKTAAAR